MDNKKMKIEKVISTEYKNNRTSVDAFILLLKKYKEENGKDDALENLYQGVKEFIENQIKEETGQQYDFSITEFEELIQGTHKNLYIQQLFKKNILNISYDVIGEDGKGHLGNYAPIDEYGNVGYNSSSWFCHVLQTAEFAADLAAASGLDSDTAKKLAILHDIGRTKDHSFAHTIKGAQILMKEGWNDEWPICLTHSYLAGDIAANNELAPKDWRIDQNGKVTWENKGKTEMAYWLENYKCNEYDFIMQLSDLLIEQRGKVDIKSRLDGIKKRRESKGDKLDLQPNRAYFLTQLYNSIINIMCKIDSNNSEEIANKFPKISFSYIDNDGNNNTRTVEEVEALLYNNENSLSNYFSNFYQEKIRQRAAMDKDRIDGDSYDKN